MYRRIQDALEKRHDFRSLKHQDYYPYMTDTMILCRSIGVEVSHHLALPSFDVLPDAFEHQTRSLSRNFIMWLSHCSSGSKQPLRLDPDPSERELQFPPGYHSLRVSRDVRNPDLPKVIRLHRIKQRRLYSCQLRSMYASLAYLIDLQTNHVSSQPDDQTTRLAVYGKPYVLESLRQVITHVQDYCADRLDRYIHALGNESYPMSRPEILQAQTILLAILSPKTFGQLWTQYWHRRLPPLSAFQDDDSGPPFSVFPLEDRYMDRVPHILDGIPSWCHLCLMEVMDFHDFYEFGRTSVQSLVNPPRHHPDFEHLLVNLTPPDVFIL